MMARLGISFVRSFVAAGISKSQTFGVLTRYGMNYGRAKIFADYDRYAKTFKNVAAVKKYAPQYRLPRNLFTELDRGIKRRYQWEGRVKLVNQETGSVRYDTWKSSENQNYSLRTVEQKLLAKLAPTQKDYLWQVQSFDIEAAYHNYNKTW